ncbi:MAG: hypothetical protein LBI15_04620 [Dysgonamonadaceae bacterium]|jgi:hypothetical protein|nr:hypothetical protein [Dysgonamonadaceae bacterium]
MAVSKIRKISSIVFLATVAVTLVIMGMFVFGGQASGASMLQGPTIEGLSQPKYLDLLINWAYTLVGLTIAVLLLFALYGFITGLKDNPKKAIGGLVALVLLVVLLFITYSMGSGDILNIPGYNGPHNVPTWLKFSDMMLYATYVMIGINILAIIIMPIIGKRK